MSDSAHQDCKGWCSEHNPLRSVSYHPQGAYLSGNVIPCYCLCVRCVTRGKQIDDEIYAANAHLREEEAAYAASQTPS